ncbi:MAG: iron ABC transporter permease [Rhodocyclaceae bacterium]|nr:iron ABC transporter permease [Rhodocyclaceae bacterium]MBK6678309.1 iron ABC transporter permease [Rhodocyclaceae bacterium]MBK9310969.1 iron ABC transporter permease [Rhodocyclaceae bacterium]MBK9953961.1 iron ABC transporter permease [Rhodocyclaceae bacterium]
MVFRPLPTASFFVALLVALPVLSVGASLLAPGTGETLAHLAATVLPEAVANSLWLCLIVGLLVASMGTVSAWLVAMREFPGRRVFEWALLLPMAMPAYVLAYTYTDFLQFVGPVQSWLRESFGWRRGDYWFPEVRSLPGAAAMLGFVLYPYVYLLARTAFLERAAGMIEAARVLGASPAQVFFRVSVPLARPAIAVGVALALMETMADYGTVAYFAVPTFTTGIYRAWFALGDRAAAAQLAVCLLGFVLLLLALERIGRGRARYHDTSLRRGRGRLRLHGFPAFLAFLGCLMPILLGFLLPAGLLLRLGLGEEGIAFASRFPQLAGNSLLVAGLAAAMAGLLAVLLGYGARLAGRPRQAMLAHAVNRLVGLGYAVPGSVIAVGVLIPVTRLDHWLAAAWQQVSGSHPGLILTGGIAALIYAYLARFLSIALQTVESGLAKITPAMDAAARSLGCGEAEALRRVHLPLLSGSLLTAVLLVFVDVMKELPATLVMRPFNFDTLATQTYTLAADERLAEASLAALAIVAVGLLPIYMLARQITRGRAVAGC